MLRKRVIPVVLLDGFSVLKTINFKVRRNLGSPVAVARTYNTRNVDELILLDIDASKQNRAIDAFTVKDIARDLFMPLTVGGGIRTVEDVRLALSMGADKVAVNSQAIATPEVIRKMSRVFGSQCIVASIDVVTRNGNYFVYNRGKVVESLDLVSWCKQLEQLGAGEILIYNVTRDGSMKGPDTKLAGLVSSSVSIPVIYAGGISSTSDCVEICKTDISAVGVSSIFHFTSITPDECKLEMKKNYISVRL